ncbi:MAG: SGNH/GDSL hydrolase family protein, partial [Planctomycetaceae bacterium]
MQTRHSPAPGHSARRGWEQNNSHEPAAAIEFPQSPLISMAGDACFQDFTKWHRMTVQALFHWVARGRELVRIFFRGVLGPSLQQQPPFRRENSSRGGRQPGPAATQRGECCGIALLAGCVLLLLGSSHSLAGDPAFPKLVDRLKQGEPTTVVCLGDSVTGIYYHTGGVRAYPELLGLALTQACPSAKITLVNAGISGNSTVDALARLERDVLNHKPHLVTVMFGLNDMTRVPLEDYRANLTTIITMCRQAGAEVLLCTPNGVIDTAGRPIPRLVEYCDAMKQVGRDQNSPVCDVYAAYERVRAVDPQAWRLLFSDQIHPNLDGHRLNAIEICRTVTGQKVSLESITPPHPAIGKTLARARAGEPVRVLAMPPYDELIGTALRTVDPQVKVEVRSWLVAGKTLAELELSAKEVRKNPAIDLVLVAVPLAVTPGQQPSEEQIWSFSWVMNNALAFGRQEWDVVVIAPSVLTARLSAESASREEFTRRL